MAAWHSFPADFEVLIVLDAVEVRLFLFTWIAFTSTAWQTLGISHCKEMRILLVVLEWAHLNDLSSWFLWDNLFSKFLEERGSSWMTSGRSSTAGARLRPSDVQSGLHGWYLHIYAQEGATFAATSALYEQAKRHKRWNAAYPYWLVGWCGCRIRSAAGKYVISVAHIYIQ